jgi:uncharacterized protein YqgC (DUF456 family)
MDIAIIVVGILLLIIGFVGSVLPVLPGPPLSYSALLLLLLHPAARAVMETNNFIWLIVLGILTLFITAIDYYMPIWGTQKFGGTKAGSRGSTIGLMVAVLLTLLTSGLGAILIIVGPFLGAYLGEKHAGQTNVLALQSAKGSFLGFIAGTFMKVLMVTAIAVYFTVLLI